MVSLLELNKINIGLEYEPQISIPSLGAYPVYFKPKYDEIKEDIIKYKVYDKVFNYLENSYIIIYLPIDFYREYLDEIIYNLEIRTEPCNFNKLNEYREKAYLPFIEFLEKMCKKIDLNMGLFLPNTYLNSDENCFKHLNISNFTPKYLEYIISYIYNSSDIFRTSFLKKMISIKNDKTEITYTFISTSTHDYSINRCLEQYNYFSNDILKHNRLHIKVPYDFTRYELIEHPHMFLDCLYDLMLNKKSEQRFLGYTNMGEFIKLRELI